MINIFDITESLRESILDIISEASLGTSGAKTNEYADKYVKPHIGSDKPTHPMHQDSGHLKKGDSVSIVSHGVENGKHHLTVKGADGKHVKVPMGHVAKPSGGARTNVMGAEDTAISDMHSHIQAAKGSADHVKVNVNGKIHHITGAEKVKGTPKADFRLTDKHGDHVYISHKDGKDVTDYQQFGGALEHKHTAAFKALDHHIKHDNAGDMKNSKGTSAVRLDRSNKEDNQILHKAAFGADHGKEHGINNVHAILQGKVGLKKNADGTHSMDAHHVISNTGGKGELPKHIGGFLSARVANGRSDGGHKNTRLGVIPTNIETGKDGRKITTEIKR